MNFGILCNGDIFQQWQADAIKLLINEGHSCKLLIVNANPVPTQNFSEKLIHYPYSKALCRFWFRFMIKPEAKKEINLSGIFTDMPRIACLTTTKGISEYFDSNDIDKIEKHNLDFILRFGFGIIKGEILESAKYGVWSYHHDDDKKYRGVPTGFWEIMYGDAVNAAILQQLTNKIDSGIILHKAWFATINHSWEANLNNLLKSSVEWPLQVCRKIESGDTGFLSVPNPPGSAIYKMPGNLKMLKFLMILAANKIRFHFRDLFRVEDWHVGIVTLPVENLMQPGEFSIPEPTWLNISSQNNVYYADPMGFVENGDFHIVCEEYDYASAKGILTYLQIDGQTNLLVKKSLALEKEHHLAFPYLFEFENVHYCLPENSVDGNVDLYTFDIQTGKLVFDQTLIENLHAIDTSLFYHEGFWWLIFTDKTATNERLNIWYSEKLTGPYSPHANNPVKVDVRSSRPAGKPFFVNGELFRPAQDCSVRSGRRICINRVTKLSPISFHEQSFCILNPAAGSKFADGMHTFCVTEGAIIVDGKREIFIRQAFTRKLKSKIGKITTSKS